MTGHEHGRWCLVGCDEGGSEPLPPADLSRFSAPAPVTAVDVDALDKLREAATAGPWVTDVSAGSAEAPLVRAVGTSDGFEQVHVGGFTGFRGTADAALIVAAVNALPELLVEVRRGRALREAVEGLCNAQGDDSYVMTYALRRALGGPS